MDNKIITGNEPAYPILPFNKDDRALVETAQLYSGLTIRQEFAKAAMQGLCADRHHFDTQGAPHAMAELAVMCADALIRELNIAPNPHAQ